MIQLMTAGDDNDVVPLRNKGCAHRVIVASCWEEEEEEALLYIGKQGTFAPAPPRGRE